MNEDLDLVVQNVVSLTLLHSERPKLYSILVFLSAIGLTKFLVEDFQVLTVLKYQILVIFC